MKKDPCLSVSLSDGDIIDVTLHKTSHIDDIISDVYCKQSSLVNTVTHQTENPAPVCVVNLLIWQCVCVKTNPLKQHLSLAHPVAVKCTNNSNSKINKWAIDFPECSGLLIGRPAVRADTFFIKKNWITVAFLLLALSHTLKRAQTHNCKLSPNIWFHMYF